MVTESYIAQSEWNGLCKETAVLTYTVSSFLEVSNKSCLSVCISMCKSEKIVTAMGDKQAHDLHSCHGRKTPDSLVSTLSHSCGSSVRDAPVEIGQRREHTFI